MMSKTGSCSQCRYSPVAFDARRCPNCGASNPNPGIINRFVGRGMLYGLGVGAVVGGIMGWNSGHPGMSIGGAMLGAIPGLFVGLLAGLVTALVSLSHTAPPKLTPIGADDGQHPHEQTENVYLQFAVNGFGSDADFALRNELERVLDAELKSFDGGRCGGGDMGSNKATVFLVVHHPNRAVPRLLQSLRGEGLLINRQFLLVEDTDCGYKFWWPERYEGTFSLL